jgi:hypothetical protein
MCTVITEMQLQFEGRYYLESVLLVYSKYIFGGSYYIFQCGVSRASQQGLCQESVILRNPEGIDYLVYSNSDITSLCWHMSSGSSGRDCIYGHIY